MKINNILYTTKQTNNFGKQNATCLTRYVRRHRLAPQDADRILLQNPNTQRYLGNLPPDWIKLMGEENREEKDDEIKDILSFFAKSIYVNEEEYSDQKEECKELEDNLSRVLNTKVKAEYLDEGEAGKVFKLDVNDKSYALKTFHNPTIAGRIKTGHGMKFEPLDAAFIERNIPKSSNRYTTFYLSKYARENEGDGFILSEYIDNNSQKAKQHQLRTFFEPIYSFDTLFKNNIGGKIYDVGGIRYTYGTYNREENKIIRILCDFIAKGDTKGYKEFSSKYSNTPKYKKAITAFSTRISLFDSEQMRANAQLSDKQSETLNTILFDV